MLKVPWLFMTMVMLMVTAMTTRSWDRDVIA